MRGRQMHPEPQSSEVVGSVEKMLQADGVEHYSLSADSVGRNVYESTLPEPWAAGADGGHTC